MKLLALLLLLFGGFFGLLDPVGKVLHGKAHHFNVLSGFVELRIDAKGFLIVVNALPPLGEGFSGIGLKLLLPFGKDRISQVVVS